MFKKVKFIMKRKSTLFIALLLIGPMWVMAQPWQRTASAGNLHEVRQNFEAWKASTPGYAARKGWKSTERWLWLQENHLDQSGNPDVAAIGAYNNLLNYLGGQKVQADGGNWAQVQINNPVSSNVSGRIACIAVDPTDTLKIYIGTPDGGIWRSTTGGMGGWTPLSDQLPTIGVSTIAIDPLNTSTIYIGTGDRDQGDVGVASDSRSVGLLKSTDAGTTWVPTGMNWTVQSPTKVNKILLSSTDHNTLVVATSTNMQKSTDGGATWSTGATDHFLDVVQDPATPLNFYAVAKTQFYRSTDGGSTFSPTGVGLPSGASVGRIGIAANATYIYAIVADQSGSNVGVYRSSDQGATFAPRNTSTTLIHWAGYYSLAIWTSQSNPEEVYTGAVVLSRSTDGGSTWVGNLSGAGNFVDHHDITKIGNAIVVGVDQGVYYTYDNGNSWTHRNTGMHIMQHYRLDVGNNPNHRITTGVQDIGGLFYSNAQWGVGIGGDGTGAAVDQFDANKLYCVGYNSINASTDGGGTWPYTSINSSTSTEPNHWVFPVAADPTAADGLYAGYVNLFRTSDLGVTWQQLSNFTDINSNNTIVTIAVSPASNKYIFLCKKDSILRTTDGGVHWENVTAGLSHGGNRFSDVWVHGTDLNVAWVSVAGYSAANKVYETTDGGATWTNLSAGLPNIPANCGVHYTGSTGDFFLGMDDGVYHHSAVTGLWTTYSNQLPKAIVTDIVINNALSMVYVSTLGRGIWNSALGLVSSPSALADQPHIMALPNPANDHFQLRYTLKGQSQGDIRMIDAQGGPALALDRNHLPAGVYFVSLRTAAGQHTTHLVLQ
jgi:Sortilin, neurotensin receptor 3,